MTKARRPASQGRFGQLANKALQELFNGDRERMGLACRVNPVSVHRWVTGEDTLPNSLSLKAFRDLLGLPEAMLEQYLDGKIELSQLWDHHLKRDYSTVHEVDWVLRWARTLDKRAQLDIGATLVAECAQSLSTTPGLWESGGAPTGLRLTPRQCRLLIRLAGYSLSYQRSSAKVIELFRLAGLSPQQEAEILAGNGVMLSRTALNAIAHYLLRPSFWGDPGEDVSMPELLDCEPYRSADELLSDLENWEQASQQTPPVDS